MFAKTVKRNFNTIGNKDLSFSVPLILRAGFDSAPLIGALKKKKIQNHTKPNNIVNQTKLITLISITYC